jgi:OOP family OmpA-OmpF porin
MINARFAKGWIPAIAAALFTASCATTETSGMQAPGSGNVPNSEGKYVVDSSGKCVKTPYWSKDVAVEECNPELFVKEEPKEVIEEVVVMPPPEPTYQDIVMQGDVLFDFDKATIKPEAAAELQKLADAIRDKPDAEVTAVEMVGYTDSTGPEAYNMGLSERRAEAVKNYVVENYDADASEITTRGMGEADPVASNATREGRSKNRRVEIHIELRQKVMQ